MILVCKLDGSVFFGKVTSFVGGGVSEQLVREDGYNLLSDDKTIKPQI
jgi:hypothetical protein